jgi:hypothetical protein
MLPCPKTDKRIRKEGKEQIAPYNRHSRPAGGV